MRIKSHEVCTTLNSVTNDVHYSISELLCREVLADAFLFLIKLFLYIVLRVFFAGIKDSAAMLERGESL